jgi:hypothetical protein
LAVRTRTDVRTHLCHLGRAIRGDLCRPELFLPDFDVPMFAITVYGMIGSEGEEVMGRRYLRPFLITAACSLAAFIAVRHARSSQTRPITPLTVNYQEVVRAGANVILEKHSQVAVRSDGAVANRSLPSGKHNTGQEAWNVRLPKEGKYVVVVDVIRAASTFYFDARNAGKAALVSVSPGCQEHLPEGVDTRVLGEANMLGYTVVRLSNPGP